MILVVVDAAFLGRKRRRSYQFVADAAVAVPDADTVADTGFASQSYLPLATKSAAAALALAAMEIRIRNVFPDKIISSASRREF
jgi:hypothetical protein